MTPLFGVSHDSVYVYRLNKTLYDLKQAPYAWFKIFLLWSFLYIFVSSRHDSALFVKNTDISHIIMSLYVDDIIIINNDINDISVLKT